MHGLYSHFRPLRNDPANCIARAHPAGGALPPRMLPSPPPEEEDGEEHNDNINNHNDKNIGGSSKGSDGPLDLVTHHVNLDPGDSFLQLCVATNLVKLGPRSGVFSNLVNVSEGLVRVWDTWLAERAGAHWARAGKGTVGGGADNAESEESAEELEGHGKGVATSESKEEKEEQKDHEEEPAEIRTLWLDNKQEIGLRVRVRETCIWPPAVLTRANEAPSVRYTVQYEGML